MTILTIISSDGAHVARCCFGATSAGSPLDSMDAFLKELKAGVIKEGVPASWLPMDCGELGVGYLGDDFRLFVKKKLIRINRTTYAEKG